MPTYEYECTSGHVFELIQSIHSDPIEKCECGSPCERIISGGYVIFEPKTVGSVAEQNRKKMGKYELESKEKPYQDLLQEKKDKAPPWRPGTTKPMTELNNKTPEQLDRYIREGK